MAILAILFDREQNISNHHKHQQASSTNNHNSVDVLKVLDFKWLDDLV